MKCILKHQRKFPQDEEKDNAAKVQQSLSEDNPVNTQPTAGPSVTPSTSFSEIPASDDEYTVSQSDT